MCNPASMIVTKSHIFWSKSSNRHEDIIAEHQLQELDVRGEPTFVRIEISPLDNDLRLPLQEWKYRRDQDIIPDWYDAKIVERRARATLKEWHKQKILLTGHRVIRDTDQVYAYGNSTVRAYGNSTVRAYDNSTIEAYDNSTVRAYGNSTIIPYDNSTIEAYGNSTIISYNNSTVEAYGNSTIISYNNLQPDILKTPLAILIVRTASTVECYKYNIQ